MSDEWPEPPRNPGPFAGGPAVGPPVGPPVPGAPEDASTSTPDDPYAAPSGPSVPSWDPAGSPSPFAPPSSPVGSDGGPPPSSPFPAPGGPPSAAPSSPFPAPGGPPGASSPPPFAAPSGPFAGPADQTGPAGATGSPAAPGPTFGAPGAGGSTLPPPPPGLPPGSPAGPSWGGPAAPAGPSWGGPAAPAAWPASGPGGFAAGPPSGPADRAPGWLLGLAALVVVLLIGGAAVVLTSKSGPSYPDEWDPRVAPLAAFAAEERGLEYEHPVTVNFLTPEEYSEASRSDTGDDGPTEEEKAEMDEFVAMLRALGLVSGTFDVEKAMNQIADSGTLAFYSPVEKQVYVRGTELTPALRVTLVHELTHVLQDQHFDLEQVGTAEGPVSTTIRALAEGDAGRVEEVYAAEVLTDEEREAYEKQQREDAEGAEGDLADVPEILTATFGAPYAFGPAVIQIAFAQDGNAGVDALFEAPPSEFALFDPIGFPAAEHPASEQERLEIQVPEGAEKIDEDTFGPVFWYLLLSARIGEAAAFDAVEGVSADGFLSYRQDGEVCVKGSARAEKAEADELRSALESWAAKGPKGAAEIAGTGEQVELTSCDPGKDAESAGEVSEDALILPVRRNYTFAQIIDNGRSEGASAEQAECYALGIFDLLTTEEIVDPAWTPSDEQEQGMQELGVSCR